MCITGFVVVSSNSAEFASFSPNTFLANSTTAICIPKQIPRNGILFSLAYKIYGEENINERHRHRFEYNNDYKERLEKAGLICSGTSPDGKLVEIVEIPSHPYFIAGQFHPELKSRPNRPSPLFVGLVKAAKEC